LRKDRHPLHVGDHAYLMVQVVKLVSAHVYRQFGARGVAYTFPQTTVLVRLRETAGQSAAELARVAMVRPQTMNKNLARLYRDGLIEARDDPAHGRIRRIFLTKRGLEIVRRFDATSNLIMSRMFENVGPADQKRLESILQRCVASLKGDDDLEMVE
jgi:DNA-binding MarR family transcriptional regulator